MDALKEWAVCLCIATLVGAIVHMLSPSGSMEKILRIVISIFFICAVVSPFLEGKGIKIKLEDSLSGKEDSSLSDIKGNINKQITSQSKKQIENLIRQQMKKQGINEGQIFINMDIDDKGSILIKKIEVVIPDNAASKKSALTDSIKKELGIDVTVLSESEAKNENAGNN